VVEVVLKDLKEGKQNESVSVNKSLAIGRVSVRGNDREIREFDPGVRREEQTETSGCYYWL
jgi:hypothetical protein